MVFELLGSKSVKVPDLLAKKKYPEALALLQEQLKASPGDTSLRMQTADVLVLQGKIDEATRMLEAIADDFATQGFAAKAIAVLKKIQKLDPQRKDLEQRIVDLLKSTAPPPPRAIAAAGGEPVSALDFGIVPPDEGEMLDLGLDLLAAERPAVPAAVSEAPAPAPDPGTFATLEVSADIGEPTPRVSSPLFGDFSEDELLEVIRGLELLTYEPGDIIVTEGEKGDSLYVITSGVAKAFVRNRDGGSTQVRQLQEGDFFGEISVLSGKPRTATITAGGHCETLRLDRAALDAITATRPRVRQVLQQFYDERTHNAAEAEIRGLDPGSNATSREAGLADAPPEPAAGAATAGPPAAAAESPILHLRKLAIDHSRRQNWADAVQAWQQYIALEPGDVDACNTLGLLFGKLGRWMDAAQTFERLAVVHSSDPTLLFNLGLSYRNLDLLPQAASAFRRAISLKPDYDNARKGLASVVDRIKKGAVSAGR